MNPNYDKELAFVTQILETKRIKLRLFKTASDLLRDLNIINEANNILHMNVDTDLLFSMVQKQCKDNTFYHLRTSFLFNFIIFKLPNTEESTFAYVGPYLSNAVSKGDFKQLCTTFSLKENDLQALELYYLNIPIIENIDYLTCLLDTLGKYMWDDLDNFTHDDSFYFVFRDSEKEDIANKATPFAFSSEDIHVMEQHNKLEKELLRAVSVGQTNNAQLYLSKLFTLYKSLFKNKYYKNIKIRAYEINAILKILVSENAIQATDANTIFVNHINKLETLTRLESIESFLKEMINNYCSLVRKHSLKSYSPLIRKVLLQIDLDLTADLSLKTLANMFHFNPSYLSALFKKEMGMTLTEYVNQKRIQYAVHLLIETDLKFQTIASYCGIQNVNYFIILFKKYIGKTPTEFKNNLHLEKVNTVQKKFL